MMSTLAAAAWGGWSRVERELSAASWLDSSFDGLGRELLARAALARGADSLARAHAERAIGESRTERDRGVREVLLARALDRQAVGDSAAAMYIRAARRLPTIGDWLQLRAAGATADASRRRASYSRVTTDAARQRIAPTEAQARERWRDFAGAARAYADMGEKAQALRLRLLASPDSSTKRAVRGETFALLATNVPAAQARIAIALVDSMFAPLSKAEQVVVARAANEAGVTARAATGFAAVERDLDPQNRYAYALVLLRLDRDAEAMAQLAKVPATSAVGPLAAYQLGRTQLRAGQTTAGRTALRRIVQALPRDTNAAAPALFLLADLASDEGRDREARSGFEEMVARFPTSDLAPVALFRAGIIAYAAGSFDAAKRDFDLLIERYPRSVDVTAARYWSGRARQRSGDRKGAAERWREVLSGDPLSYYAMQSSAALGVAPWAPARAPDSVKLPPSLQQASGRAALLDALGMSTEEGFEYDAVAAISARSPDSLLAAAQMLLERGETSRAMGLARRALAESAPRDTRLFRLMYPLVYGEAIRAEARVYRIDPALVASMIRQESSFNPRATSRAGAVGLMQVLPGVGADIARAQRMTSFERVLLYQPDVNVRLGMAHLDAMLRQYPRIEYALAAYNAGGAPVRRWRRKPGTENPELFIERIPYDETRDYVRILLRDRAMYRALWGQTLNASVQRASVGPTR
jgi:soluble lytic murein transglycosylase